MSGYEEMVELGFEGVDKFADKYHDKVYDHLPAWKQKQKRQEAQDQQRGRQHRHDEEAQSSNIHQRSRRDSGAERDIDGHGQRDDRDMSSYAPSYAPTTYAPDGRQDYRDDRNVRYVRDESVYYKSGNAGPIVMRDNTVAARTAYEVAPYAPQPYGQPGYGNGSDPRLDQVERGRPQPSRMRSNSWSPPRNERHYDDESRRRRRSKSRSRSRSRSRDTFNKERIAATLIGGLIGGFAGNRARKGQKYDTAATVGGAVLGGIAAREAAERFGSRRESRKERRSEEQEAWEQRYGDGGGDNSRDDDRRRSRSSRGWCDRCGSDRSRCRCR